MVTSRNPLTLAAVISLWLASVGDWPLWRAMGELPELASVRGMQFIASLGLMVAGISLALLALGAWRRSIKPLAALPLVVAAIGAHFMGSYSRITNPGTVMLGLVGFSGVSSCGTNTAASLSCMFSHLGGEGFGARKQEQESLRDLLRRAGLATLWLDNQSGCKRLCERVPNAAARDAPPGTAHAPGLCRDGECLAEALLTGLDQRLAAWPEERRQRGVVLVLHQMGSHGPAYCRRSPPSAKPFLPKCTSHALQGCDRAALVNAYDNSSAYTDHVLATSVAWLSAQAGRHDPMLL